MPPHRTLIVCSLVLLLAACSRPQQAAPRSAPNPSASGVAVLESPRPSASVPLPGSDLVVFDQAGRPDRDRSIARLTQRAQGSESQNPRVLVLLAALHLERARGVADRAPDRELARALLTRALEIDENYPPALNRLAIYHLEARPLSRPQLDLASRVVERAIEQDAAYAPAYNTEGLIQAELGNTAAAARAFALARQLDPDFLEAHMNYAAVSLGFRGFADAEQAYRAALVLEPRNFEAHLGLALALRGQLHRDAHADRLAAEIERELELAAEVAPLRFEVGFNRALFLLAWAQRGTSEPIRRLEQARAAFMRFVEKAGDDPRYADAVAKAREHLEDLTDAGPFVDARGPGFRGPARPRP